MMICLVINLFYSESTRTTVQGLSATLLPTRNPSTDQDPSEDLRASHVQTIHYNQMYNRYHSDQSYRTIVDYEFALPTVVLDDISQINVLNITNETIVIAFDSTDAYAQTANWSRNGIALVIKGQCLLSNANDVFLLNNFMYDSNSLTVTANYVQNDISNITTNMNVTLHAGRTNYSSNVQYVDTSFFPNSNSHLNENYYSSLTERNDTILDEQSGGYSKSLSEALHYDMLHPRYYNDENAYNLLQSKAISANPKESTVNNGSSFTRGDRGFGTWIKENSRTDGQIFTALAKVIKAAAGHSRAVGIKDKALISPGNYDKAVVLSYTIGSGQPFEIFSDKNKPGFHVRLTCQECQVQASFNLHGKFVFTKRASQTVMDSGFIEISGKMVAKVVAGISVSYTIDKKLSIAAIRLPVIGIPGIIDLGPEVDLDVGVFVTIQTELVHALGAYFTWNNAYVKLDLKTFSSSQVSGWTPDKIEPKFDLNFAAKLDFGVYVEPSLAFDLVVFNGLLKMAVALGTKFIAATSIGYNAQPQMCPGGLAIAPYFQLQVVVYGIIGSLDHTLLKTKEYRLYTKQTPFPFLPQYCTGTRTTTTTTTTTMKPPTGKDHRDYLP